jgi:hypothetical protein
MGNPRKWTLSVPTDQRRKVAAGTDSMNLHLGGKLFGQNYLQKLFGQNYLQKLFGQIIIPQILDKLPTKNSR